MAKLLILNDTSDILNWGTQSTMHALTGMLNEYVPQLEVSTQSQAALTRDYHAIAFPFGRKAYIRTASREARGFQGHRRLMEALSSPADARLFPPIANGYEAARRRWLQEGSHPYVREFMLAMEQADLVLHNGELLNYSWNPVGARGMFLVWLAKKELGKLSGVINQTVPSPGSDPAMSGILRTVCPELDVVTVREPHSHRALDQLRVRSRLVPDPTFWLSESSFDEREFAEWRGRLALSQPYFCLSLSSGLPLVGSVEAVENLVVELQKIVPTAILLAYGGGNRILKVVASRREHCHVYVGGFQGVWPLLREAVFLVSGHYHNIIMGTMVGCPFVPLAGLSHKVESLLELIGWPHPDPFNVTALAQETPQIIQAARTLISERSDLSRHLIERSVEMRQRAADHGLLIRDLLARL